MSTVLKISGKKQLVITDAASFPYHEIIVERQARLELTILAANPTPFPLEDLRIMVHDDAAALLFSGLFAPCVLNVHGVLHGNRAVFEHHIAYFGRENHQLRIHVSAEHIGKGGMSRIMSRGVACGRAHAEVLGAIAIAQTAAGSDARWEHEGLLFSKRSRIDALPGLSIDTNDVKASHASAIHFIRPEQLFYAQTRGIDKARAREMIVQGFLSEMVRFVHDPVNHQALYDMIEGIKHYLSDDND